MDKYEELDQTIRKGIESADTLYKKYGIPQTKSASISETGEGSIMNPGIDLAKYRDNLWTYFTAKYEEQTTLKASYFDLQRSLYDKACTLTEELGDLQRETAKYESDNNKSVATIKDAKSAHRYYKRDVGLLKVIIVFLVIVVFALLIRVHHSIFMIMVMCVVVTVVGMSIYVWHDNTTRSNTNYSERHYEL